jgi:phosphatidate cytidylyltransferase
MGACLIALAAAMLLGDRQFQPWFPFLFLFVTAVGLAATFELLSLLPEQTRPPRLPCLAAVLVVLAANWPYHLGFRAFGGPLELVGLVFALSVLGVFLLEMARYREPGGSVVRIAVGVWVVAYLGLLPSFLAQLRWPREGDDTLTDRGAAALALAIFVPKFCDIGAYFTGRFLGRHPMTPILSPKKTREGYIGGLVVAVATTVLANAWLQVLGGVAAAVGFGVTVGLAAIYGDLAESLIKRDCRQKDASSAVPGFGGVLDVIDSILFAAPVAYCWLR